MSPVLVDSSVWIEYFNNANSPISSVLDNLIDIDNIFTNDLILAELLPFLISKKLSNVINSLESIPKLTLDIDWKQIIDYQVINLKNGINKVGIPDLIIAQNAIQNNSILFSLDKHFILMSKNLKLKLYS
ncbi:MAG: PIN domain-containing protein [Leptospira sp.]|nr:PIN domain-containing protein [Leptospira sp.]NCS92596.1 PIN domain-containing protein [Leptospira sp.]